MIIQQNISLKDFTTFKIGGPAKYFAIVKNREDLREAIKFAKEKNCEIFILGGGSNVLISDKGFNGLAIKMENTDYKIDKENEIIIADSGLPLVKLVEIARDSELSGFEWAYEIPGTVGGAIRGNASAFGGETKNNIIEVEVFDLNSGEIKILQNQDCDFEYRRSFFKEEKNLIILSGKFQFKKAKKEEIQKEIEEIKQKRTKINQPHNVLSAGSFFANAKDVSDKVIKMLEEEKGIKIRGGNAPAGWLIDRAGLKGKKINGAMVSPDQANFIINTGNATAEDVLMLVSVIKQKVRDEFGVELVEEVQYVGFN